MFSASHGIDADLETSDQCVAIRVLYASEYIYMYIYI